MGSDFLPSIIYNIGRRRGDKMDKQILEILTDMSKQMKKMTDDINELKSDFQGLKVDVTDLKVVTNELRSEMHSRFDSVDSMLDGIGNQFEFIAEARITDVDFITEKVHKLEKDVFKLKSK